MLPTMIPNIYFYDTSRKCFKITYYEKDYMESAYYSYETVIASTYQDVNGNNQFKYHIDPDSEKYSNTTAKHIKLMLGFDKKQYRKEWERSQKREAKLQNSPNCHIDTYHEVLYTVSDLFIPFGSMDVRSFAEEFLWATQTFFGEQELVEAIENQLEDIGAEPGDINNYIYAMYCAIEEEIWNRLENMPEGELVDILRQNGWNAMAKHVEHLIEIDELSSEIEETKARRMNDTQYNINYCASSFNWEPLDQSFRSEKWDATIARVFEGAYRQYIDKNYDGICDAENEEVEE
jgi:hypothetical protein